VTELSRSLPRASGSAPDFLALLARSRAELGDVFVVDEAGPIFSRAPACTGVVALFGPRLIRQVLNDAESFALPISAASARDLPETLVNLNRGLHSRSGAEHAAHRRIVGAQIAPDILREERAHVESEVASAAWRWRSDGSIPLLAEMRRLMLAIAGRLMLGAESDLNSGLADMMYRYFTLRRQVLAPAAKADRDAESGLRALGAAVDRRLRDLIRAGRELPARAPGGGLVGRLAAQRAAGKPALTDDEIVGHANVLFISMTEPIAASLTWLTLVLSQRAALRLALREERGGPGRKADLFDCVMKETLRLLTPNALMVRRTARPVHLDGGPALPRDCEVVLCPFLVHREARVFPDPGVFAPARWKQADPSPYEYLPFGGGVHRCPGSALAFSLIRSVMQHLLGELDLVPAAAASLDWNVDVMLLPSDDPRFEARPVGARSMEDGPAISGPVADLFRFAESSS
jgi:cytochrome P450